MQTASSESGISAQSKEMTPANSEGKCIIGCSRGTGLMARDGHCSSRR